MEQTIPDTEHAGDQVAVFECPRCERRSLQSRVSYDRFGYGICPSCGFVSRTARIERF